MVADPESLEDALVARVEEASGKLGETIIAFCLRG
jgi:hypothetical protein